MLCIQKYTLNYSLVKRKGPKKGPFGYFLFRGIATQSLKRLMRNVNRLRLLYLLDLRSSPTVLPSLLSTPVETRSAPSKVIFPHFLNFWIRFACTYERPYMHTNKHNNPEIIPMPFHKIPFGGAGRNRTAVQKSFALKELQQFFKSLTATHCSASCCLRTVILCSIAHYFLLLSALRAVARTERGWCALNFAISFS